ncbi:MAG: uridine kinase [Oscillospiraceae bacterium]|nr:uridine kinase [Oscillospiraceae bacterium]
METLTIGIAGGTGSGKTTITKKIIAEFGSDVSVIHHDSYYKAHDDMTYEERCKLNYDHPDSFDTPLLLEHLRALKAGKPVDAPVYDYTVHNRSQETERINPARVLLVEGILIYAEPELCRELDIKIYVDTDADVRILRRIVRDVKKRGRTLDSVIDQYLTTVKPMHEEFVEPSKRRADIIIPEGGRNTVALEMVLERIRGYLGRNKNG